MPAPRLARLRAAGWRVEVLPSGGVLAATGAAEICHGAGWSAIGLVFLEDPAGLATRLEIADTAASDLELVLTLRARAGPQALREVTGAMSVVFVAPQDGAVELWRDHWGLYPAYYTGEDRTLTCGSDIRACLHVSNLELAPDPVRLADFIHGAEIDLDRTVFQGLKRLPPAHHLHWAGAELRRVQGHPPANPADTPPKEAAPALRAALTAATSACLRPPLRTGAMLSGGLDSSTLAGLAAETAPAPLQTLSFVYGRDRAYDETPFIDAAAARFGVKPHKIPINDSPKLEEIGPLIDEQMDLFLAPGLQKSRRIYTEAHALGLEALLDGHGGDEVISHGYGRLVELAHQRAYAALWREARGAAAIHGVPFLALVAGHLGQYGGLRRGHPLRRVLMKIARHLSQRAALSGWREAPAGLIAPALRQQTDAETRYRNDPTLKSEADFAQAERIQHLDALTDPLMVQSFEVLHRSATASGVLPRYPFFDSRVVSLCLALPSETKLRGGQSRWILREAMRGVLPEEIRTRPDKAEFGAEVRQSVLDFYRDRDGSVFAPLAPWLDLAAAERLRAAVLSGALEDVAAIRALWRLAVLHHWQSACARWRAAQARGELI